MNGAFAGEIVRALSGNTLPEASAERLRRFTPAQWRRSLEWFHAGGVALYFWQRMKQSGAQAAVPREVQTVLEDCLKMNRQRTEQMTEEFQFLNQLFRESGIQHAALKGFALVPDYCPDPGLRNQYDFDFLVPAEQMDVAGRLLQNAGFARKDGRRCSHPVVYLAPNRQTRPPADLADTYSPLTHRSIEVHSRLWESDDEKMAFELPANPLARAGQRDWNGIKFYALAPEDALVFQVLHAFRHMLNNRCRLSIFLEIARFVNARSPDGEFWQRFGVLLVRRVRLREATAVVFSLALRLFGSEASREVDALLSSSLRPAAALWVSRYGVRLALENFSSSKGSLHLHKLFVDDAQKWAAVKRRKLYPFQRPALPQGVHSGRLRARSKQAIHVARRILFHLSSALRYLGGLPAWNYAVRAANRTGKRVSLAETLTGSLMPGNAVLGSGENND